MSRWSRRSRGRGAGATAGFSPSGRTLAVATSSDLTLWTRQRLHRNN
ncbi:hypothetical protein [Streptomyces sp. NPDC054863]